MSTNYPVLWQNALGQFTTEIARKAWVWFAETRGHGMQYQADAFAMEVDILVQRLSPMMNATGHDAEVTDGVLAFLLQRHANWRLGGNVHPPYIVQV